MRVYLAARYSRREELLDYREDVRALGFTVDARWLNGEHQITDAGLSGAESEALVEGDSTEDGAISLRQRFALDDWEDVQAADWVVCFTEPPRSSASRGGRHVEFGIALALGKTVMVVGPRENIFTCLPRVQVFDSWKDCLIALETEGNWNTGGPGA